MPAEMTRDRYVSELGLQRYGVRASCIVILTRNSWKYHGREGRYIGIRK